MYELLWLVPVFLLALSVFTRLRVHRAERLFPPGGKFVSVNGVKLHYLERGEEGGQPVVFLHGGVLRANDFDRVLTLAAAKGYRALAFDRPGYGYSERGKKKRITPADQAVLIHQALKALGIGKPVLVGHSWSGLLVLTYAYMYPEDTGGLVILGGGMYKEGYPAEKGDPISAAVTLPVVGKLVMYLLLATVGRVLANRVIASTFAPEPVPARYREETLALWLRPSQFLANREDVLAFAPAAEQMSGNYARILTPTVLVVGGSDPFSTRDHSYRLYRDLPHARLVELSEAAHMIPHHHPDAVMEAVEQLLSISR